MWCKRDSGTWGPNYANVVGNLIGGAISNFYYPASERTVGGTLGRGFAVTAQAIIGSEIIEFWPDMVRYHRRKQAEKLASRWGKAGGRTARGLLLNPSRIPPPSTLKTLSWRYFHHVSPAGPHILTSLGTEVLG